ncbi:MAG: hypothetical protein IJ158_05910 [Treponema sp.]|nr:hypothetical protein [Treponema sp.]
MSDTIRTISTIILFALAFFCFQAGIFLFSGHKFKNNSRRTLILIQFITGILLVFDALAYIFRGNTSQTGFYMVRMSNFVVFFLNCALPFFICFYCVEFIKSDFLEFKILKNLRLSVKNGVPPHLFVVFYICLAGVSLVLISQFTNLYYYFDESNFYHRNSLYPLSVVLGFSPGLVTLAMLLQYRKSLQKNVFISLLVYSAFPFIGIILALFIYGFSWINIGYGVGALHLFYSSLKLLELEFYSEKKDGSLLSPDYKQALMIPEMKKRISKSHLWQVICALSGGLLLVLVIVSITGINIPKKTLIMEKPDFENDKSKPVCMTFSRNAEKVWNDNGDLTRIGAQYDGVIYNNMRATIITDWSVTIDVSEDCAIDPGPWNGTFSIVQIGTVPTPQSVMSVKKPHDEDKENIHGADFYQVTPLKTLGFGCIMYSPASFSPAESKIVFSYESLLKPLSYIVFDVALVLLSILFIVSLTVSFTERKIIRIEEENRKLEDTVRERTKELREEKNRSESLLLNILPEEIAKELTAHPDRTIAKSYPNATVLFTDIVGFTKMSGNMTAENVVAMLNLMISRFDERAKKMGIEKIKTIGDAYMAAVGLTEVADTTGAAKMIEFAKGLISDVDAFNALYHTNIKIRLGINTGELVAGVIGKSKFIYDIWGDTVNVASRMESTGEPMRIHVSESTHAQTARHFAYGEGIELEVKGKGQMKTYYL